MDDLHTRLRDVHEAGVYRLNCTADVLREAAHDAGFMLFELDLAHVHNKGELLAGIAETIGAPEWFGNNWDALGDALGDLSWCPAKGYVVLLRDAGLPGHDEEILSNILLEVSAYWEMQGKAFWAFYC